MKNKIKERIILDNNSNNIRALSSILDEYSGWYGDLLACLFYPAQTSCDVLDKVHGIFDEWLARIQEKEVFEGETLRNVNAMHKDLKAAAQDLVEKARSTNTTPDYDEFAKLSSLFEGFTHAMRRLEKDSVLEDSGIDVLTGLRSKNVMHDDLNRELERLARRGKPFCLALAQIDNYQSIVDQHSRAKAREYTKAVSILIKKSIRSFDDGYRLGNGEFILCLKQADISGGVAALERLKKMMEAENISVLLDGEVRNLTMSCCIAEPLPEDRVEDLIANLRTDLVTTDKDEGMVLQYHEMSDLERFLHKGT